MNTPRRNVSPASTPRAGKALVVVVLCLPMVFGMLGLVIDGSLLMNKQRELQTVTDSAAPAAAKAISNGGSISDARSVARNLVQRHDGLSSATLTVNHPPQYGSYAGDRNYVEVIVSLPVESVFRPVVSDETSTTVRSRAVAGIEDATGGGALVVLDPNPSPVSISGLPAGLPALGVPPVQLGGLEVLGTGQLSVNGGVFVNNVWGGVDQNGDPAGETPPLGGLQHAVSTTPLAGLNKLLAEDIWVVGGVDRASQYGHVQPSKPSPLRANKTPVSDPLASLPVPTLASDGRNVDLTPRGHVNLVGLPLLSPPVTLRPGVYESINIVSGRVNFEPGIYIVRGRNAVTGIALSIVAGIVRAEGVMFYITNTSGYSPGNGLPDAADGSTAPSAPGVGSLVPSVVINASLPRSSFSGLDDSTSRYHGIFLFQRRADRRPMVVVAESLLGANSLTGTIYSKWGQLLLFAGGTHDLKIAVGTARIVNARDLTLEPTELFPPVREVFLVE